MSILNSFISSNQYAINDWSITKDYFLDFLHTKVRKKHYLPLKKNEVISIFYSSKSSYMNFLMIRIPKVISAKFLSQKSWSGGTILIWSSCIFLMIAYHSNSIHFADFIWHPTNDFFPPCTNVSSWNKKWILKWQLSKGHPQF